jgi:hypothetical protein
MFGTMGDSPKRAGRLMPPATTRRLPERPVASTREARIVPPFIPSESQPASAIESDTRIERHFVADTVTEPEPLGAAAREEEVPPAQDAASEPEFDAEPSLDLGPESGFQDELETWDDEQGTEGTVESAFAADTDAVIGELTQQFPLDAFIVPEEAQHVPSGLEGTAATPPPEHTPASSLAERLEKLSHRLRVEDSDAIVRRLAGGDRLDALLAGLLAGYLAGKSEQQ